MALGDVPYSLTRENLFPDGCEGFFREVGGEANGKNTQKKPCLFCYLVAIRGSLD